METEESIIKTENLYTIDYYIDAMATTIQVSTNLLEELKKRKLYDKESYEEIIWDLLEDTMEVSDETKKDIEDARKDFKAGRCKTLAQIKKESGL